MEKSDRGALLLSVPWKLVRLRIGMIALALAGVLVCLVDGWLDYRAGTHFSWMRILAAVELIVLGLAFAFVPPWSLKFFEKGVQIPRNRLRAPARFLPWSEVERYYWVGDMLYLSTAKSVVTWTVQPRNRAKMDVILAERVAVPAAS